MFFRYLLALIAFAHKMAINPLIAMKSFFYQATLLKETEPIRQNTVA